MREIKFNFWDTWNNKMIYWDQIINKNLFKYFAEKRYIPLQFTNNKDRKNKEIYEGDILKTKAIYPYKFRRNPKYEFGIWVCYFEKGNKEEPESCFAFNEVHENEQFGVSDFVMNFGKGEVIGNKYENQELLKGDY